MNLSIDMIKSIMFDVKELRLMFIDPLDLLVKRINLTPHKNKMVKFIFS